MPLPTPKFCTICGTTYATEADIWPKRCPNPHCEHEDYGNPPTVAVVVCGVGDHALVVRRNINPGRGRLACPGGWVNRNEGLRPAASRELREETERRNATTDEILLPGLVISPDNLVYMGDFNVPNLNRNLVFYGVDTEVERRVIGPWWESVEPVIRELAPGDIWNRETQRILLLTREEVEAEGTSFSSHLDMLREWFARRTVS